MNKSGSQPNPNISRRTPSSFPSSCSRRLPPPTSSPSPPPSSPSPPSTAGRQQIWLPPLTSTTRLLSTRLPSPCTNQTRASSAADPPPLPSHSPPPPPTTARGTSNQPPSLLQIADLVTGAGSAATLGLLSASYNSLMA
jgi:hypothetical protein